MSFKEASMLEHPLALKRMMRANTVEHKLNPKLPTSTKVPWTECILVLITKENASREQARRRDLSRHGHHRHGRCFRESRRTSAAASTCARLADVANSGADTTRSSARKRSRQIGADQHSEGTLCPRQVPAQREVSDCQVRRARPQNCHFVEWEKLAQELMSLETLALKSDPLSDDEVRRGPVDSRRAGRVGEGSACIGIFVAKPVQAQDEHTTVATHSRAPTTTRIQKFRISQYRISKYIKTRIFNVSEKSEF